MRCSQRTKRSVSLGVRFKFISLLSLMLLSLLLIINGETYAAATSAINSGGPAYVATDGTNYQADTFYTGGAVYSTGAIITGTTDPILYQTQRYGNNFSYSIPVPNGTYTVILKFAEIYWNKAGQRKFNVFVQGVEAIIGLDVFTSAGGQNRAYDVPIPNVSVTSGNLNLDFEAVTDNATVSAIEIVSASESGNGYYAMPSWNQILPASTRFIVLTNMSSAAVLDRETGLVWEQSPITTPSFTWLQAQTHCNGLTTGGRSGWRLPTVQELGSLRDLSTARPYVPSSIFPTVQAAPYWSATASRELTDAAWCADVSSDNFVELCEKVNDFNVWCVRGGHGVDPQ